MCEERVFVAGKREVVGAKMETEKEPNNWIRGKNGNLSKSPRKRGDEYEYSCE